MQPMVALKTARIGRDGVIVGPDRAIRTTKDPDKGGPDQVQWIALGNGQYEIRFEQSPFQDPPSPESIRVAPVSGPLPVKAPIGEYKYSVYDLNQKKTTDDPEVIVDA